ncbi:endo-1,4-beta-xylanase [Okibacterium endophyticum]
MRRIPATAVTAIAVSALAVSACSSVTPSPSEVTESMRPIVRGDSPVALASHQQETVVWPIWGGAFVPDEPVTISGRFEPDGDGSSGIVIAGPGDPKERLAVEILASAGQWIARETTGGEITQEKPVDGDTSDVLTVDVLDEEITIVSGEAQSTTLDLSAPLAAEGEAAGLYAYLEPGTTLGLLELESSQPLPAHPELGTALRELADGRGVEFGSALDIWPPLHDIGFESLLGEQFNAATPTEFYWTTTRGEDSGYFFVPADLSVNYATVHDQAITGMFLVWDFELPQWVLDIAETGDADQLGEVYDEHITTLATRYADAVDTWVVVNEAIWGPDETGGTGAAFAETVWLDVLGEEHIERAFRTARAADPDAELMYNETGAEELGAKSDFLYDTVAGFVERGVPIDTVGLQFHVEAANPPDLKSVQQNMQRFADLGLGIRITELDVTIEGTSEEQLDLQAQLYADIVDLCLEVAACAGTTVFGFSDRHSWDELGEASPLLFTEDNEPKPAFRAVQEALAE